MINPVYAGGMQAFNSFSAGIEYLNTIAVKMLKNNSNLFYRLHRHYPAFCGDLLRDHSLPDCGDLPAGVSALLLPVRKTRALPEAKAGAPQTIQNKHHQRR